MSAPPGPPQRSRESATNEAHATAWRLRVAGQVQGVGFRPFVYRLARELNVTGSVQNLNGDVEIIAQGTEPELERFARELVERAPPIARARVCERHAIAPSRGRGSFSILESAAGGTARIHVPPDYFTCDFCLAELLCESDRRYRYPFINCTQCGPRYTLITALPYDRPNTTMVSFALCAACRREYEDPSDRRFHAEPVACPACGPRIWLDGATPGQPTDTDVIGKIVELLSSGAIVAVKGVGGYHLLCDATNATAVARLRERKGRPHKPLAVMFPQAGADGLECIRKHLAVSPAEARVLMSGVRPIVLLNRLDTSTLPDGIAPGLNEVGAFLPYSPLHHLLLAGFGKPLIATSGNISGEPVLTDQVCAHSALSEVADAIVHHDRPIARPADDSVVRVTMKQQRTLRLGRGMAPLEMSLPCTLARPLLAVGGHLKNTIALAWEDRVVVSPHIADMGSVRSEDVFEQLIEDLQRLYAVEVAEVVCDTHPDYTTSRWASRCGLPVTRVLHHHSHASALAGEHHTNDTMLVFAWDGVGLGADGTLWGGETFLGKPGAWQRVASFRPFRLPGGDRAGRSPWRSAAALCWELGESLPDPMPDMLARAAWEANLNCPLTSSVGRLFDGAAALLLKVRETSYEGQGPMMLEAMAARATHHTSRPSPLPHYREPSGLLRIDWAPLVRTLMAVAERQAAAEPDVSVDATQQAAREVHETLAATVVSIAVAQRGLSNVNVVGLTGGVFQNVQLTSLATDLLTREGFQVRLPARIPCGDGGLSYGQIVEFMGGQALRLATGAPMRRFL
ncbi:MAG TPA: carbamoyltransferase HypF [Steroidobacteraceae bacterium]